MYSCAWLHCFLALPLFLTGGYFILSTFHNLCTCCLAKEKLLNFNFLTKFWLYFWVFNHIFTVPFCTLVCHFRTLIISLTYNFSSFSKLFPLEFLTIFHWTDDLLLSWQVHFITKIAYKDTFPLGFTLRVVIWGIWYQSFGSLLLLWLCTNFRLNHNFNCQVRFTLLVFDIFHSSIITFVLEVSVWFLLLV